MKFEKKKIKILIVLIIFLIIMISLLRSVITLKEENETQNFIAEKMSGTTWPLNDVPILYKENMKVEDDGYVCEIEIPSGVTYDELREYLTKLYESGFEPNKNFGSDNPKYMNKSTENMELKEVLWIGAKDNYEITVTWAEEGATNEFGDVYNINFIASLYTNPN